MTVDTVQTLDTSGVASPEWIREKRSVAINAAFDALANDDFDGARGHLKRAGIGEEEQAKILGL